MSKCMCRQCRYVVSWPDFPATTALPDKSDNHRLDCHYLTPLINGVAVLLKRDLVSDGASIPRFAWRIVGHPWSKDLLPHAFGHDGLYASEILPREACDAWFLESMARAKEHYAFEVGRVKRNAVWAAVRAGGGCVWGKHTPESVALARTHVRLLNADEYDAIRITRHLPENW